jgi:hypothetical protein
MAPEILNWVNGILLVIIGILVRDVWADVRQMKIDIRQRTMIFDCEKSHTDVNRYLHKHGTLGAAGEVVPK